MVLCVWACVCCLFVFVSLPLSPFLFHTLPVLCPAHHLQCRHRRRLKPLHSRTMRSIAPWRFSTLSHIPCRTWHWPQAQVLPHLSFRQFYQHTHKTYGTRWIFSLRCSTAECRIKTNLISHTNEDQHKSGWSRFARLSETSCVINKGRERTAKHAWISLLDTKNTVT